MQVKMSPCSILKFPNSEIWKMHATNWEIRVRTLPEDKLSLLRCYMNMESSGLCFMIHRLQVLWAQIDYCLKPCSCIN